MTKTEAAWEEWFDRLWNLMLESEREDGWSAHDVAVIVRAFVDEGLHNGDFFVWCRRRLNIRSSFGLGYQLRDILNGEQGRWQRERDPEQPPVASE